MAQSQVYETCMQEKTCCSIDLPHLSSEITPCCTVPPLLADEGDDDNGSETLVDR